jgi:hypothetical protein
LTCDSANWLRSLRTILEDRTFLFQAHGIDGEMVFMN